MTSHHRSPKSRAWGFAAAAFASLAMLVVPSLTSTTTAILSDQASATGNSFSTAATFVTGGAYVWDQTVNITSQRSKYRLEVTITIRSDSDGDGIAEASDIALDGASVSFELRDGTGAVVASSSGTTDAAGQMTTRRFNNINGGSYQAVVTALTHATEMWVPALDAANPKSVPVP